MPLLGRGAGRRRMDGIAAGRIPAGENAIEPLALAEQWRAQETGVTEPEVARGGFFATCSNPGCQSGWMHLMRSRSAPVFEGGWTCSSACTEAVMAAAVHRELTGRRAETGPHRHRVPLGLVMLEQGWIAEAELRRALDAQRAAGQGRLGDWLMRLSPVAEERVTRAVALQWRCPVLPLEFHDAEAMAPVMPRLFVDAFGAMPLRVAAGRLVYLGFEDRLDPVLALGLERMSRLRVETGLVQGTRFRLAHQRLLKATFPHTELIEVVSEPVMARVLARAVERVKPLEARLVRVHDCLWLRLWHRRTAGALAQVADVEDVVCSLASGLG